MASAGIMDRKSGRATRKTVNGSRAAGSAMAPALANGQRQAAAIEGFLSRLAQRQTALELSDRRLARLLKVDSTTVSRWKRGRGQPRVSEVVHLIDVLRCDPAWLLIGGERRAPTEGLDRASFEAGVDEGIQRCREAIRLRANVVGKMYNPAHRRKGA